MRTRSVCHALLLAALLFFSFATYAAEEAGTPANPSPAPARAALSPELKMVLDKLDEANQKVEDVRARLTYERAIPWLDERERSKGGSLVFKKPAKLILNLGKPRNEEVYSNGKKWWVVSREEKQVEIYDASPEGQEGAESAFLQFGYGQDSEKLLEDYDVELSGTERVESDDEPETLYRLRFQPRLKEGDPAPRYAAIEVEISSRTWLPTEFVLHESDGRIVHTYRLSRIRLNTGVKDKEFEYTPPRGYEILKMGSE